MTERPKLHTIDGKVVRTKDPGDIIEYYDVDEVNQALNEQDARIKELKADVAQMEAERDRWKRRTWDSLRSRAKLEADYAKLVEESKND